MNEHDKIHSKCTGCNHVAGDICCVYLIPSAKWRAGNCPMCTTVVRGKATDAQKKRVGQQKQKSKTNEY